MEGELTPEQQELLSELSDWQQKELESERNAVFARAHQARIIGQLASQEVYLYPFKQYEAEEQPE